MDTCPSDRTSTNTYIAMPYIKGSTNTNGGSSEASDEPCFSREAEACRILDTSFTPSAAFRACFEAVAVNRPSAERVKMTALTAGDYVLSAGKDQAYEFTRVIVNQHKLNEARCPPYHHHAFAPAVPPPRYPPT